jgi:O-antigen/teichoic acid export membrane protein
VTSEASSDYSYAHSRTVIKNTTLLICGQAAVQVSSMILGMITARILGETGYGQYSLAMAFAGTFSLLFTLGVDALVVRSVAQAEEDCGASTIGEAIWLRLAGFPLALTVTTAAAWLLGYQQQQRHLVLLASVALGLTAAADLPRSYFRGRQKMHLEVISRVVEKTGTVAFAVVGLVLTRSPYAVLIAMVVGATVALLLGSGITKRLLGRVILGSPRSSVNLLKRAAPLAAALALVAAYNQLPVIFLSQVRDVREVGLYSAAHSVVGPLNIIPLALGTALLPALSASARSDPECIQRDHGAILSYILIVALPLAACVILFRMDLIQALFGNSFLPAASALLVLGLSIPVAFCSLYLNNLLIALGRQNLCFVTAMSCLIVTIPANVLLVPWLGFLGTAISYFLVYTAALASLLCWTSRWVTHRLERKMTGAVVGSALMLVGVFSIRTMALYIRVPVAAGLYAIGFVATSGMSVSEIGSIVKTLFGFG